MLLAQQVQKGRKGKPADGVGLQDISALKAPPLNPLRRIEIERVVQKQKKRHDEHERHHVYLYGQDADRFIVGTPRYQKPCDDIGKHYHKRIQDYLQPVKIFLVVVDQNVSPLYPAKFQKSIIRRTMFAQSSHWILK